MWNFFATSVGVIIRALLAVAVCQLVCLSVGLSQAGVVMKQPFLTYPCCRTSLLELCFETLRKNNLI